MPVINPITRPALTQGQFGGFVVKFEAQSERLKAHRTHQLCRTIKLMGALVGQIKALAPSSIPGPIVVGSCIIIIELKDISVTSCGIDRRVARNVSSIIVE